MKLHLAGFLLTVALIKHAKLRETCVVIFQCSVVVLFAWPSTLLTLLF